MLCEVGGEVIVHYILHFKATKNHNIQRAT